MLVLGMTQVRQCCTFLWMQEADALRRTVFTRPYHCGACVREMARSAKLQRVSLTGSMSMERVGALFWRERAALLARWDRQLRAVAESGAALDAGTSEVLPELIDAAVRALERRYRSAPPEAQPREVTARRAAIQSSLLGDFLFDATLSLMPELNAGEQRMLSDALAHAGVEVMVRRSLAREQQRRARESARLARLAHHLRDEVTAAQLALDLLRKRGALAESKVARSLCSSVAGLRASVEDTLLDESLAGGEPRLSSVRLLPVLADARAAADVM
ncbi:MAG TPA: hypothetical protein VLW85_20215, partial [Myxococcales bacterium]|nr:hypothetical protein [Myxococcales bacterium]